MGYIGQAIIGVKVPNCSLIAPIQHCRVMEDRNDKVCGLQNNHSNFEKMRCEIAYGFRHRWQKRRAGNKHMDIGIYQIF